jgi:hypothetical protein
MDLSPVEPHYDKTAQALLLSPAVGQSMTDFAERYSLGA